MSVLFILIGASILVAFSFLLAFIWSVKTGQYEDDYTPSVRMLFDNTIVSDTISHQEEVKKDFLCNTDKTKLTINNKK